MSEFELDAKRLLCPMPVIRTQNKVKQLQKGDVLNVVATDPGVKQDIPSWCRLNGHQVLEILETEDAITVKIKVGK